MKTLKDGSEWNVRPATANDVPLILQLIRELAEYEKLSHQVIATEAQLKEHLFGAKRHAEVLIGERNQTAVAFALFFHNFSTFVGKPGIYLEDLFVKPDCRGLGLGKLMLKQLAALAVERGCGRLEWAVLDWNQSAITFYESLQAKPLSDWIVYRLTGDALTGLGRRD